MTKEKRKQLMFVREMRERPCASCQRVLQIPKDRIECRGCVFTSVIGARNEKASERGYWTKVTLELNRKDTLEI